MPGNGVELVWDGKRKDVERVPLPFQRVEIINESRATRQAAPLFAGGAADGAWDGDGWRNKLIWGDNKYVLSSLIEGDPSIGLEPLAGKVDLIYIDPPFATGADFSVNVDVGDDSITKEPTAIEEVAYRDTWGLGLSSYLAMLFQRLLLIRELLSPQGSLYVHVDNNVGPYVRLLLDEIFGSSNFINAIAWKRSDAHSDVGQGAKHLGRITDTLFYYSRVPEQQVLNMQFTALPASTADRWYRHVEEGTGRRYNKADITGPGGAVKGNPVYEWNGITRAWRFSRQRMEELDKQGRIVYSASGQPYLKRYLDESKGVPLQDLWDDIKMIRGIHTNSEASGYATQKPEALIERIIQTSSNEGSLVADFFLGSGTTATVAEKLGRKWIACDLGRFAIHTSRKRLLGIEGCKPFEVLNLGRYERRYWQGINAGEAVYEYFQFIVKLYHAEPVVGFTNLHGRKGEAMVHVGATDAPVTIAEVRAAMEECTANGLKALDVLGWEWEMGLNSAGLLALQQETGIAARLFHIPHEVMDKRAVAAGDVHFYEAAYVAAKTVVEQGRVVRVELTDFLVAIDDYIREKVGDKVKKWSDWIDYWAVDFEYNGDIFHNQWQAYRTRKEPKLELTSGAHTYESSGKRQVLVKVVDIFGNDTTALLEVEA